MAKKQEPKAKAGKSDAKVTTPERATKGSRRTVETAAEDPGVKQPRKTTSAGVGGGKAAAPEAGSRKKTAAAPVASKSVLQDITEPVAAAASSTKAAAKKALKSAKSSAVNLRPEVPTPDLSLPKIEAPNIAESDVVKTAKDIGGQIMSVLNTDVGRVIAAEVLIYLAKSLTKAAANTDAGKDAADTVLNAGAKIGAAVASAGARAMEGGGDVAEAGAQAASEAAVTAKGVAREVAQVAVSTVGGVVLDAADKILKRRGRPPKDRGAEPAQPSPPGLPSPVTT